MPENAVLRLPRGAFPGLTSWAGGSLYIITSDCAGVSPQPIMHYQSSLILGKRSSGGASMEPEDLEPRKKQPKLRDLTLMGLEELAEYRASLEAEILRIDAEVAAKRKHRSAIDGLFKS